MSLERVVIVHGMELVKAASLIPNVKARTKMVMELIEAYGLFQKMEVTEPRLATSEELLSFHSNSYLEYLEQHSNPDPNCIPAPVEDKGQKDFMEAEYGLGYDCPVFENMRRFSEIIAGGSLTASESLISGKAQVAINWSGGWHHASRDSASGFCYVNDIVIAIQALQKKFKKVLYIDIDVHHGDGVENAFNFSNNVFTLSFHNYEPGYFPGTGSVLDIGRGKGKGFTMNVPLKSGMTDDPYISIFSAVLDMITPKFRAEVIVMQCGADSLGGDPLGTFNLTEFGYGECLKKILNLKLPTLLLGGGGYNSANAARCWSYLTSIACGVNISSDIPDHEYFMKYGPDFDLHVSPTLRRNENSPEYLNNLLEKIKGSNIMNLTSVCSSVTQETVVALL